MSLLGKQDLNILVDEVKKEVNRKVNAIGGSSSLDPSDNIKHVTQNGVKEFDGKNGYVDNIYIEGETLVNVSDMKTKNNSVGDGVLRTRFSTLGDDYKYYGLTRGVGVTLFNYTDKPINFVAVNSANAWITGYRILGGESKFVTIPETEAIVGVDFHTTDGWDITDMTKFDSSMFAIIIDNHEGKKIPYFKGIASVGQNNVSVLTCTKNPINIGNIVVGAMDTNNGSESVDPNYRRNNIFVPCNIEEYTINTCDNKGQIVVLFYDENKNYISFTHRENANFVTFTPPANARFLRFRFKMFKSDILSILYKGNNSVVYYDKQYINQTFRKTSKTVKDLLYKINDKYYKLQKCVKITLDPNKVMSELWFTKNADGFIGFKIDNTGTGVKANASCICDRFRNLGVQTQDSIHVSDSANHCFAVSIHSSNLATQDVPGFKKWLTDNPTPLVIELETPIMVELPNFNPRTFDGKNTIIFDSGVAQCEANFETTNAVRNEIDVIKDKVNSAFLFGSNVKNDLADKLTSVGVPNMSANNTFAELIASIPMKGIDVKIATGQIVLSDVKTKQFNTVASSELYNRQYIELNLGFKPNHVIVMPKSNTYACSFLHDTPYRYQESQSTSQPLGEPWVYCANNTTGVSGDSNITYLRANERVYVSDTTINIPVMSTAIGSVFYYTAIKYK